MSRSQRVSLRSRTQARNLLGRRTVATAALLLAVLSLSTCGGDETVVEPTFELAEMYGDYALETLTFDPRGSLPLVDVRSRLQFTEAPELLVAEGRQAQLLYREGAGLRQTVSGSWQLTTEGIRLTLGDGAAAGRLLIPRTIDLDVDLTAGTLTFNGAVDGGLSRTNVIAIAPEWEQEQLLDPVPGDLVVRFRKPSP